MVVKFNYKYYNDPNTTTTYQYHFDQPLHQGVARELKKSVKLLKRRHNINSKGITSRFIYHTKRHRIFMKIFKRTHRIMAFMQRIMRLMRLSMRYKPPQLNVRNGVKVDSFNLWMISIPLQSISVRYMTKLQQGGRIK